MEFKNPLTNILKYSVDDVSSDANFGCSLSRGSRSDQQYGHRSPVGDSVQRFS
jgi:hypothetical protein